VPRLRLPDLVVKNAAALYGVQCSRKLIPLAAAPYLARVLRPEGWGEVAVVTSMAELVAILIEFGFNLSATRSIARYREDAVQRGQIATGVLCAQALLAVTGAAAAVIMSRFIPLLRDHPRLLACGLVYAFAQGFSPLWYFQGMERLRLAAGLETGAKLAALGALFIFVHSPQHVWRALAIQALSPFAMMLVGIPLALASSVPAAPQWRVVKAVLADGWHMFAFRSAESLYGVANAFLLGLYAPPVTVGYFSAAEKVSKATAGLLNPIRESLYPRISHLVHRDPAEASRLSRIGTAAMIGAGFVFSVCLFTFAGFIITKLMGGRFEPAVQVLQILSPLPLLLGVTFASGQLWLIPRQKDQVVLRVVWRAGLANLMLSFLLAPRWGHLGMAVAVLGSECLVATNMLWNVVRHDTETVAEGILAPSHAD
jgi:PST family polysaccharide transporter